MSKQCYNSDGQYRTGYAYSYQDSCVELHQDGGQGGHGGHRRHSGERGPDNWIIQLKCELSQRLYSTPLYSDQGLYRI